MIKLVVAVDRDTRVVGRNGEMPWHVPEDLKRFQELTKGNICIVGWNTFLSIQKAFDNRGKTSVILPGRTLIVLTKNHQFELQKIISERGYNNCHIADSKESSLKLSKNLASRNEMQDMSIIGGPQIYTEFINEVDRLCITYIDAGLMPKNGDSVFIEYERFTDADGKPEWIEISNEFYPEHNPPIEFSEYARNNF